jgi:hypothetical protein
MNKLAATLQTAAHTRVDSLATALLNSALLLASKERHLWDDEGSARRPSGIPVGEAIRLVERAWGRRQPARELVGHYHRRGRIGHLVQACLHRRPGISQGEARGPPAH